MMDWLKPWSWMLGGVVVGNFFIWWLLIGKGLTYSLGLAITAGTVFVLLIGIYELTKRYFK
jgi:hypothetical protein